MDTQEKIKWYKTKERALASVLALTQKYHKSFMMYELPESVAFAVMSEEFFWQEMAKQYGKNWEKMMGNRGKYKVYYA